MAISFLYTVYENFLQESSVLFQQLLPYIILLIQQKVSLSLRNCMRSELSILIVGNWRAWRCSNIQ